MTRRASLGLKGSNKVVKNLGKVHFGNRRISGKPSTTEDAAKYMY